MDLAQFVASPGGLRLRRKMDIANIRRRFVSGRRNFETRYRDAVDAWAVYDNSREDAVRTNSDGRRVAQSGSPLNLDSAVSMRITRA